jgi:RNA polymerase sigma-70 factor (ECF subfamily)
MLQKARLVNPQTRPGDDDASVEPSVCAQRLEEAFVRWQGELVGTLYHLVGNLDDARDALQEAFIKAWRQQHQVPQIENLKAWIFRIALNTGRDLRESAWRRRKHGLPEDEGSLACPRTGPSDEASRHEELELLRQALRELRSEEQEVFLLRQNGDMTYEEIGAALEIPVGTVKTRMRLAIAKLRQVMAIV